MKTWTIGRRIIATSATLIALLLVVGAIGVNALREAKNLAENRLRDDTIPGINCMSDIIQSVLDGQINALMAGNAADDKELATYVAAVDASAVRVTTAFKGYEDSISTEEDRRNFAELTKRRSAYVAARQHYIDLIKAGHIDAANAYASTDLANVFIPYREHARMMLKWNQDAAVAATGTVINSSQRAQTIASVLAVASVIIGALLAWISIRSINHLLGQISVHLDESANQVASAAAQVSSSSQSLAEGSSEQAASLEESSSSLEELTSMTKRNAESAGTAKALSGETRAAAEQGNNDMGEMREAMESIKTSSADIAKIIKTIDEIAFQTNILALNAAVEAARAGEAGMGFAVVAEEVRALAQRSANSAKETASKIEIAIRNSDHGALISEKVAASLGLIVGKARRVDELIGEIATASNEQTQGIGQINAAVSQMDKVTQANAGSAEETAAAAEELNGQSASLKDSVAGLRRLVSDQATAPASTPPARATTAHTTPSRAPAKPAPAARPIAPRPATPAPALSSHLRAPALIASDHSEDASGNFFKDV